MIKALILYGNRTTISMFNQMLLIHVCHSYVKISV